MTVYVVSYCDAGMLPHIKVFSVHSAALECYQSLLGKYDFVNIEATYVQDAW